MAFCTFCGKQLADGEVCTCQQQAAPQQQAYAQPQVNPQQMYAQPQQAGQAPRPNVFKEAISHIVNTVKKPLGAAEEFYEKGTIGGASIIIGMVAVLYVFATLLNLVAIIVYSVAKSGLAAKWVLEFLEINGGTFVQAFFFPIIYMGVLAGAVIGLTYLVNAVILKRKTDIKQIIVFCGAVSVPIIASLVLVVIDHFIHVSGINWTFSIVQKLLGFLTLLQGLLIIGKEITDRKKLLIALAIGAAGLILTNNLINLLMNKCIAFFTLPM